MAMIFVRSVSGSNVTLSDGTTVVGAVPILISTDTTAYQNGIAQGQIVGVSNEIGELLTGLSRITLQNSLTGSNAPLAIKDQGLLINNVNVAANSYAASQVITVPNGYVAADFMISSSTGTDLLQVDILYNKGSLLGIPVQNVFGTNSSGASIGNVEGSPCQFVRVKLAQNLQTAGNGLSIRAWNRNSSIATNISVSCVLIGGNA